MLNIADPEGSALSLCFQSPSQEAQKPVFKKQEKKQRKKSPDPCSGERSGKPHSFTAALFRNMKGYTCLLRLRCSCWKVCAEGQRNINQSIHHKHPQHCSQVSFTCTEKCGSSPLVALLLDCSSPPRSAGVTCFILFSIYYLTSTSNTLLPEL